MMMRETVGSMRAYFIVSGLLGCLMNVSLLLRSHRNPVVFSMGAIGAIAALVFFYIGVRLPRLVSSSSRAVGYFLLGTIAYLGLLLLFGLVLGGRGIILVGQAGLGLLITWYLLRNFGRLVREARSEPAE